MSHVPASLSLLASLFLSLRAQQEKIKKDLRFVIQINS